MYQSVDIEWRASVYATNHHAVTVHTNITVNKHVRSRVVSTPLDTMWNHLAESALHQQQITVRLQVKHAVIFALAAQLLLHERQQLTFDVGVLLCGDLIQKTHGRNVVRTATTQADCCWRTWNAKLSECLQRRQSELVHLIDGTDTPDDKIRDGNRVQNSHHKVIRIR